MQINNLMASSGDSSYYDPDYLVTLEAHLSYLKKLPTNRSLAINHQLAYKYDGDLFGLLDELQVPKKYHYVTMLINGLLSSSDYRESIEMLLLPDNTEVDMIKSVHFARMSTF